MADASLTWLGHASFRLDSPGGKRIYVDPWLENPKCPDAEKEPERCDVIAVTHGHDDHVGCDDRALEEVRSAADRRDDRAEGLAEGAGRPGGRPSRPEQGRHGRGRRRQVHDDERLPLELRATTARTRGEAGRDRRRARERHEGLLRRRHLRLRRHAADRAHLPPGRRRAADRRPLHDGSAGGGGRLRAARCEARRALPLRNVPAPGRHARRAEAARAGRRRRSRSTRASSVEL